MWSPPPKKKSSPEAMLKALDDLLHALRSAPGDEYGDSFAAVMEMFFECMWDDTFWALSSHGRNELAEEAVAACFRAMIGKPVTALRNERRSRLARANLFHGAFEHDGGMAMYFWFEQERVGLLGYMRSDGAKRFGRIRTHLVSSDLPEHLPLTVDPGAYEEN